MKLATGAELEFLGTSSACSTSTRNVSSLAFHYRKRQRFMCILTESFLAGGVWMFDCGRAPLDR